MKPVSTTKLEQSLRYTFQDSGILERALTHSSHAREQGGDVKDNEQLEFLGDAVLGFVTSQELFRRFPSYTEGELSKLRAHLVSARHLLRVAHDLELGSYLRLGRGEEKTGGRTKSTLLADALEAVLAAMYLDGGLEPAQQFILERIVLPELDSIAQLEDSLLLADYKSRLQEMLHARGFAEPQYQLVEEHGEEHRKVFTVSAKITSREGSLVLSATGEGPSKKRAGQIAAQRAIEMLNEATPEEKR